MYPAIRAGPKKQMLRNVTPDRRSGARGSLRINHSIR